MPACTMPQARVDQRDRHSRNPNRRAGDRPRIAAVQYVLRTVLVHVLQKTALAEDGVSGAVDIGASRALSQNDLKLKFNPP